jgi:hypothetical protein
MRETAITEIGSLLFDTPYVPMESEADKCRKIEEVRVVWSV